jgi:hypothetical protein
MKLFIMALLTVCEFALAQDVAPQSTPAPLAPAAVEPIKAASPIKISVYALVSSASKIEFKNITATAGNLSGTGSMTMNSDSAAGLGIDFTQSESNDWGWSAGASYDSERKINSMNLTLNGTSGSGVYVLKPTFSFVLLYANAMYRWGKFYLPFGLNYSIPTFNRSADAVGTLSVGGALGAQFGGGFQASERVSVEVLNRIVGVTATSTAGAYAYDYGTGYSGGLQLNLKYSF